MKTVLIPIDFSAHTPHTTHFGVELAHQLEASVLLLHVVQPSPLPPAMSFPTVDLTGRSHSMYEQKEAEMQQIKDDINAFKRREGFPDVAVRSKVVVGQPANSIMEIARAEHPAFIVMGTVGASNAWENLVGSVTYSMAQQAEQPLWIVPHAVRFDSLRQFAYFADLEGDEVSCINQVINLGEQLRMGTKVVHVSKPDEDDYSQAEAMIDAFEVSYANDRVTFQNLMYDSVEQGVEAYTHRHWPDAIVLAHRNRGLIGKLFHKSMIRVLALTTKRPLLIIQKPDI